MQLAKVIGTVVATRKDPSLTGVKLLVIQPIDAAGQNTGSPLVAVDTIGSGYGETVFYARGKEGGMALPEPIAPVDAGIVGIIDQVYHSGVVQERKYERKKRE